VLVNFSVIAQGASHVEKNIPCQDAANAVLGLKKDVGIACAADGHGGVKYFRSEKGSDIAVKTAERALADFYRTLSRERSSFFAFRTVTTVLSRNVMQSKLKQLEANIIYNWRNAVIDDIAKNPFTDAEIEFCAANNITLDEDYNNLLYIYGSTLLAGLVSDNLWFIIQIGDGLCVVLENTDKIYTPIEADERLSFGRTTSLCDNDALENFREEFGFCKVDGLTVATDGISDSFEPEKYLQFNKELYDKFNLYPADAESELLTFLPELSVRGSRDDVAIAGLIRIKENK